LRSRSRKFCVATPQPWFKNTEITPALCVQFIQVMHNILRRDGFHLQRSFPLSFLLLTSVYVLTVSAEDTVAFDHTQTHATLHRTPLDEIGPSQGSLPTNIRHSQETDTPPPHRRDSNPQSQQASGHRPMPKTARPPGSATYNIKREI
jgi:hypothetical protein